MFCWGENTNGEIGNGTTVNQLSPTSVGSTQSFGNKFSVQSYLAYCIFPRLIAGGKTPFGQIGDDANSNRLTPTQSVVDIRGNRFPVEKTTHALLQTLSKLTAGDRTRIEDWETQQAQISLFRCS
ncbi:MAG: hypothetical protein Ct9H300mP15_29620 [Gemmatimonadota bacterium]|nr:MAG: hypothetical protein Ct9H300mP15_29620 [Gemmatimonadota bacterium]